MREALGVAVHVIVEVAGVGVKNGYLLLDGAHYARMAVADKRNIIVNVEKSAARVVVEILHPSAGNLQRLLIGDTEVFSKQFAAGGKSLWGIRLLRREALARNAEQQIWIRRERSPHGALRRGGDAGKIGTVVEQVQDNLKMKVRRPAAVFLSVTDPGELLSARDALAGLQPVKGFPCEVAVEREKFHAVAGCVAKNHEWPVVERRGIDGDGVHDTVKQSVDRRAG